MHNPVVLFFLFLFSSVGCLRCAFSCYILYLTNFQFSDGEILKHKLHLSWLPIRYISFQFPVSFCVELGCRNMTIGFLYKEFLFYFYFLKKAKHK